MATRSFVELVRLVARLRDGEHGCPWDRAQDHHSLRAYMLEEAYEFIAAIDAGDDDLMTDELGDVLLQVVLHSQIAAERGAFAVEDVIESISEKLIRRHPHVFGNASDDLPSVYRRWEEVKSAENRRQVPLPALVRARKAVAVAEKLGRVTEDGLETLGETREEKAGARILRAVAAAWEEGYDPELALDKALALLHDGD